MVIETFASGQRAAVYERFHTHGRLLPDGLHYIDSWLEKDGDRCFSTDGDITPRVIPRVDQPLARSRVI